MYRNEDEQDAQSGQFIQLSSGKYVSQAMLSARTPWKSGKLCKLVEDKSGSYLTMELQTRMGTAIRIQSLITLLI